MNAQTARSTLSTVTAAAETLSKNAARGMFVESIVHPSARQEDALKLLQANVAELTDLHARLRFVMKEVSYLIRKA